MIIRVSATEVTRPSNTTAYSAGDVIGPTGGGSSLLTFYMPCSTIAIVGCQVTSSGTQDVASTLHFVTSDTYAPGVDNATATLPTYDDGFVTSVPMDYSLAASGTAMGVSGGGSFFTPMAYPVTLVNNRLFGALVANTGFTPASAQRFTISVFVEVPDWVTGG